MRIRLHKSNAARLALFTFAAMAAASAMARSGGIGSFHHSGEGYLGVDFENLTTQQRAKLDVPSKEGVAIAAVDHDAPAGKAGLHANDVIVKMNGKKADRAEDLRDSLHKMEPGDTVVLELLRNGRPMEMRIVLADRKTIEQQAWSKHYTVPDPASSGSSRTPFGAYAVASPQTSPPPAQTGFLGSVPAEISKTFSTNGGLMSYIPGTLPYTGIVVEVMDRQLARYFGLRNSTGLLVKSIDPNSPGARAGVAAGDVICKANDAPTTTRSRWNHILRDNRHDAIKLQIVRNHQRQTLVLTLAASKS